MPAKKELTPEQLEARRAYQRRYYKARWHEDPECRETRLAQMSSYVQRVKSKDRDGFNAKRREWKLRARQKQGDGLSA